MNKFIDVTADKWYYRDIEELMEVRFDGKPFFSGIHYNIFGEGMEAVDEDIVINTHGQHEVFINTAVHPTEANPLVVFVDGIVTAIDEIVPDDTAGRTYIKLKRGVAAGSVVRVFYAGEPELKVACVGESTPIRATASDSGSIIRTMDNGEKIKYLAIEGNWFKVEDSVTLSIGYVKIDRNARLTPAGIDWTGVSYPSAALIIDSGYSYVYDPFEGLSAEDVRFNGKQLRRVSTTNDLEFEDDYCIVDNRLYTNFELNNQVLEVLILQKNSQGLIKRKWQKLRVQSPKIVHRNRFFPDLMTSRTEMISTLNNLRLHMTRRFSDSEPWRSSKTTSRFDDVQAKLDTGTTPWWWQHVRDFEDMVMPDGSYLIEGVNKTTLGIDVNITRGEMAALLDKMRIWLVEALK
jgi:hypothetical protein